MQNNSAIVRRFIEETINQGQIDSAVQFAWEDVSAAALGVSRSSWPAVLVLRGQKCQVILA